MDKGFSTAAKDSGWQDYSLGSVTLLRRHIQQRRDDGLLVSVSLVVTKDTPEFHKAAKEQAAYMSFKSYDGCGCITQVRCDVHALKYQDLYLFSHVREGASPWEIREIIIRHNEEMKQRS